MLDTQVTDALLKDLGSHGKVKDVICQIKGVTMRVAATELPVVRACRT